MSQLRLDFLVDGRERVKNKDMFLTGMGFA